MKKIFFICLVAISLLNAKEIVKFNYAQNDAKRQFPTNQNYILSYNNVLENIRTSVVNISTQKSVKSHGLAANPFMNDPFFREFFKGFDQGRIPQDRIQNSLGSGVIVSKEGYIVTNNHVVDGADKIKVSIQGDKKEYEAEIIGKDAKSDIAIIKIDADNLNAITFYDSDDVKVGDIVFAIGNPFGVGETITQGIVSATGRSSVGIVEYENFIQTDASINPGNSGGALVNSSGHLIGINSAIISKGGGNVGIGFAIPSKMVTNIATELINKGEFTRAYLGVSIADVSDDMSSFYDNNYGALITSIEDGTPAQKAGLKRGDLIISVDGKKIKSAHDLKNTIATYAPDKTVVIEFVRDKNKASLKVKLGSQTNKITSSEFEYKGLTLKELESKTRTHLGIEADVNGVLVIKVKENSQAYNAGIVRGDLIIQIENMEIKDLKDFQKATKNEKKRRIYIYRRGNIFAAVL